MISSLPPPTKNFKSRRIMPSKPCGQSNATAPVGCPKGAYDRFIPQRALLKPDVAHILHKERNKGRSEEDEMDIVSQVASLSDNRLRGHRRRLFSALLGFDEPVDMRVLAPGVPGVGPRQTNVPHSGAWPVQARQRPQVDGPAAMLDMPSLGEMAFTQLVAWGPCGVLAAGVASCVYLWRSTVNPDEPSDCLEDLCPDQPMAVAWSCDPDTQTLAVGTRAGLIKVWDCCRRKLLGEGYVQDHSEIGALAWHPNVSQRLLAVGTWNGAVLVYTDTMRCVKGNKKPYHLRIACLAFSQDGEILAVAGEEGVLTFWAWEEMRILTFLNFRATITSLSWHPWRSRLLVAGSLMGQITLVNFATMTTVQATYPRSSVVTAVSFSPLTGELVAAFRAKNDSDVRQTYVVVMSDIKTVVDSLEAHEGMVGYILWSPDGLQLATVGADETLCLWNFLGDKASRRLGHIAVRETLEYKARRERAFGCVIR